MTTYFSNAQGTTVGDHANFQTVVGNPTTNHYHNSEREDRLTLRGRTIRKVIDGDIIFQRVLSSEVLCVKVKPEGASASTESQVVKIKKMEQTARIHAYGGEFTATSFEPVDEKDQENFKEIAKIVLEVVMCGRSALLKQVFAVAESENAMTLIAHDELANGFQFYNQYRGKDLLVSYFLDYTLVNAAQALRDDETVTLRWSEWSFNVKNLAWQYDPASLCLNPPEERYLQPLLYTLPPIRQETLRHLDTAEIVTHVEESLGDVLFLIAGVGEGWMTDLSYYARHGLLTLGAVVDRWKPEILAHLPSTPSPEWFCNSHNPDVKANFSSSGQVDFSLQKTGNVQVDLYFGWRIPEKDLHQLKCAFLCQSLHFGDNCEDVTDVVFIDMVGFHLQGTFPNNPTNCSTPAYLFVHPLPTDFIDNLHCICYPLPEKPFYWSHDPQGRNTIAEEDWERFRIPKLSMQKWVGDYWKEEHYAAVREHLHSRGYAYGADGKQYAREHGYPEFIFADPHTRDIRIRELAELAAWSQALELKLKHLHSSPKASTPAASQLALPSPPSLAPAEPIKCDTDNPGDRSTPPECRTVAHWAKPVFLKWYNSVLETLARADSLDHSVVAC
ncbi:hypothetical protein PQX77_005012 [Marasmius sp. AFHP31]|nr:hypothetical protein PQX77_005012 [Marasmius sp. AFHP31]